MIIGENGRPNDGKDFAIPARRSNATELTLLDNDLCAKECQKARMIEQKCAIVFIVFYEAFSLLLDGLVDGSECGGVFSWRMRGGGAEWPCAERRGGPRPCDWLD